MKKLLILLASSTLTLSASTSIFCNAFISCRSVKNKKIQATSEEDPANFEYGSLQETTKFSKAEFNRYVNSSLAPIVSLLSSKFLDQSVNQENFDFITVLNSLQNKNNPCNALIWNKQSVNVKNYCVDTFLDDWTFSELDQKDIDLIKSNFVSRKNESPKQKKQNQLNNLKDIKSKKKLIKDQTKNIESFIEVFNSDNFKKSINIDTQIIKFIKMMSNEKISPLFLKVKSRFEQIFNNFANATNFNDIKDLTNVNGQNLISYIKKDENIKKMNENFNSKTDDDKALMLFMIKFNYMYKYISSPDANPENGQFLFEALLKDINIVWDSINLSNYVKSPTISKKFEENGQKILENFTSYFKDIFENSNSEKSLEPFYCLVEGIMYITKQKFYQTKIDQPIENTEIKLETIFEYICEFISVIKGDEKNINELKYFKFEDGKEFMKYLLLESSLLEGIFIENGSVNKTKVVGSVGIVYSVAYYLFGMGLATSLPIGLIAGSLAWWYNKTDNTSALPININDNLKNCCNTCCNTVLWFKEIVNLFITDKKMMTMFAKIIGLDLKNPIQNLLEEYRKNQDYQEYIQTFDKFKDIINDKNNNFLKDLQNFIDQGGFKNILTGFIDLIEKIETVGDNLNDVAKKQEILTSVNNLFKAIGIDRQKTGEGTIITGSVLKNLIDWINNPASSLDKTIDSIFDVLEKECEQWNTNNFEKHVDNLVSIIKDKKDIEVEYVNFEEIKDSNNNPIIKLNYKLKLLTTNEVYNIEFKNKNFKKLPKDFKISKFEKLA